MNKRSQKAQEADEDGEKPFAAASEATNESELEEHHPQTDVQEYRALIRPSQNALYTYFWEF